MLIKENIGLLVSSAACGADLLAIDVATEHDIRVRVVLPYEPDVFRETSVVDRPGNWGSLFDRLVQRVNEREDLIVLAGSPGSDTAFDAVNSLLISEVARLSTAIPVYSILVWEGSSRGENDFTRKFQEQTRAAGFAEREVITCAG